MLACFVLPVPTIMMEIFLNILPDQMSCAVVEMPGDFHNRG